MNIFEHKIGHSPLIISMPHSGTLVPDDLKDRMSCSGKKLKDTDWFVDRLYNFLNSMDVTVIKANYSRYVIDLNRSEEGDLLYPGQNETELCPTTDFNFDPIYQKGKEPSSDQVNKAIEQYWRPYHDCLIDELYRVKDEWGFALLWDAHSIRSRVARFFEGQLPDLNIGTANGNSCSVQLSNHLMNIVHQHPHFSVVLNGRFKGGYITRNYGNPADNIHAIQLEISQAAYMTERPVITFNEGKSNRLRPIIKQMIEEALKFSPL